jgi:hypothetical protein
MAGKTQRTLILELQGHGKNWNSDDYEWMPVERWEPPEPESLAATVESVRKAVEGTGIRLVAYQMDYGTRRVVPGDDEPPAVDGGT